MLRKNEQPDSKENISSIELVRESGELEPTPSILEAKRQAREDVLLLKKINKESLVTAVRKGNLDAVQSLLQNTPDIVNEVDEDGFSALNWACRNGNLKIVHALLNKGADLHYEIIPGLSVLSSAISGENPDVHVVEVLLKKGANINLEGLDEEGDPFPSPLLWAVRKEHPEMVELLLANGANVNYPNKMGEEKYTALDRAISNKNLPIVSALLSYKAEISNFKTLFEFLKSVDNPSEKNLEKKKTSLNLLIALQAFCLQLENNKEACPYKLEAQAWSKELNDRYRSTIVIKSNLPDDVIGIVDSYLGFFQTRKQKSAPLESATCETKFTPA